VIGFFAEHLLLFPLLFVTYLVLEAIEAKAGGALEKNLERARAIGPLAGALAGAVPQCGFSAVAASLYSGGVITLGTLLAVFLSTSDELLPVLISYRTVGAAVMMKIVAVKILFAMAAGFAVNALVFLIKGSLASEKRVEELCRHSRCSCRERRGILVPALIHACEIFAFIIAVSGSIALANHFFGDGWIRSLALDAPVAGEFIGAALGLIPNCAVSVACAQMYAGGMMSAGALMASSFAGSGVGLAVLLRTNRSWRQNLAVLLAVYVLGALLGLIGGRLI
jgi:hypothetical protein